MNLLYTADKTCVVPYCMFIVTGAYYAIVILTVIFVRNIHFFKKNSPQSQSIAKIATSIHTISLAYTSPLDAEFAYLACQSY